MNRDPKPKKAIKPIKQKKKRDRTRPITFDELTEELNRTIVQNAKPGDIEEQLTQFELNEKNNPGHMDDELLLLRFIAYAALKKTPPDFVLKNYYMNEDRYRNLVLEQYGLRKILPEV